MVASWGFQGTPKLSPKRRAAWAECLSRNRASEQQFHSVYGLARPFPTTAQMDSGGSSGSSTRASTTARPSPRSRSSPASRSSSARASPSPLLGCSGRLRSADSSAVVPKFKSLRDEAAYVARLLGEVHDETRDLGLTSQSQSNRLASNSGTQSSGMDSLPWTMPPLEALPRSPVPCKRVNPSCWLPFSRDCGGRYSNSPRTHSPHGKEEMATLAFVSLQSADGKAMLLQTPQADEVPRSLWRFRPWLLCTARP